MRNADRPTQPPPRESQLPQPAPEGPKVDADDAETRIQFLSWDAPLVPDPQ
jgi:hypothetical protein